MYYVHPEWRSSFAYYEWGEGDTYTVFLTYMGRSQPRRGRANRGLTEGCGLLSPVELALRGDQRGPPVVLAGVAETAEHR